MEISYDKLIFATGSSSFLPPIPGNDKKGVFTLKDVRDADNIKEAMKKSKNVVVIGGGILGLETASEMKTAGLKVTIVEQRDYLLPLQLDRDSSDILLKNVRNLGIDVLLGKNVTEILGTDKVSGIKLNTNDIVNADLIIISAGTRSNKALAEKAGIAVNKGVIVNEKMETNIKDIYACGDVAELNEKIYGLWPAAIEMGKVAGANACGDNISFKAFTPSVVFDALNTQIFSCGSISSPDKNYEELSLKDDANKTYKKFYFKDKLIVGGILLGDTSNSVKLLSALERNDELNKILKYIL